METVRSAIGPGTPTKVVRTALVELCAACIAHGATPRVGLWCVGHIAPSPCPHVHTAACAPVPMIEKTTGTSATVPTWQHNQIAVTGASTRRRCVIRRTPYRPDTEAVKPLAAGSSRPRISPGRVTRVNRPTTGSTSERRDAWKAFVAATADRCPELGLPGRRFSAIGQDDACRSASVCWPTFDIDRTVR
jgi:hypothetical protein